MDITDTIDADYTAKETNEDTHADTDPDSGVTDVTTEKPFYQNLECEPLDKTWMCSSGSKNILFVSNSAQKAWIRHIILSCDPVI